MGKLEAVWQAQASLGEGPLWVAAEQAVYWVDILTHRVLRYQHPQRRADHLAVRG